jgi:DNA-binding transcriptional LysR family regulator
LPYSRDYFVKALQAAGVDIDIAHRSSSAELVRAMVARGMGVALLNLRPAHTQSLEGKSFAILEIRDDIPPARLVALTSNPEKLTRRATAVLETARSVQITGMPKIK